MKLKIILSSQIADCTECEVRRQCSLHVLQYHFTMAVIMILLIILYSATALMVEPDITGKTTLHTDRSNH